ncbi:MAG: RHS repeat-associated core domain-containing protein, partial [Gammaproteobacteria bacterium]|nr:RHS repeat-associated core domain-containing protein [Gammaproteobacteria bacterium]
LIQTDDSGTTLSKYDYGPDRLLSLNNTTEGSQFYLFDALGSVVNLTKPDTSIQTRIQYDAWGNVRNQVGQSKNEFGFTGHEMDEESGLIYMKARFYDPVLGVFLNRDAFEGTSDTPPSLHKYLYAYGNPVVFIDPDGNAAYLASGQEFDELGYQLYQDGNKVGAAGVAVLGAAYKFGTGFFSFGLFDEANQAITDTDTYGGAAKQFGSSVANTAKEVAQEYVEEGVVAGTVTVAGKLACGRFKQACGAIVDTAKKIGDKLNTD